MQWVSRAGPKSDLRDFEAVAFLEQPMLERYLEAVELEFADAAMFLRPDDVDAPDDPANPDRPCEKERPRAPAADRRDVRATRMKWLASAAPEMNHLRPCTTYLPPLRSARVSIMPPGSEPEPGAGSVIAKAERTCPSMIGCSHLSFMDSLGRTLVRGATCCHRRAPRN